MNVHEINEKIIHGKIETDEEWLEIRDAVYEFLKSDAPEEQKKIFRPLGALEILSIVCDGIERAAKNKK